MRNNYVPVIQCRTKSFSVTDDAWENCSPYVYVECADDFYSLQLDTREKVDAMIRALIASRDEAWPEDIAKPSEGE